MLEEELGYTYDADGNRLTKTVNGVVSTYSYAAGSRLVGVSTEGELEARVTDNSGRETSLVVDGQQLSLTYDSDDHVTRVVDGSATTEFAFDALGRRVGVTTARGTKRFLTAPIAGVGYESPQAVTDSSGGVIASYVYAGLAPIAKSTGAVTEYYLTDATGSVVGTSGASGALISSVDYDAFGNERMSGVLADSTHGDFRLHGMWKDPSGLYYVRARAYDPQSGRFISRDAAPGWVSSPETLHPYAFANSNPLVWVDPTGHFSSLTSVTISIGISMALSAIPVASSGLFRFQHLRAQHALTGAKAFGEGIGYAAAHVVALTGAYGGDVQRVAERAQRRVECLASWMCSNPAKAYDLLEVYAGLGTDYFLGRVATSSGTSALLAAIIPRVGTGVGLAFTGTAMYGSFVYLAQRYEGADLLNVMLSTLSSNQSLSSADPFRLQEELQAEYSQLGDRGRATLSEAADAVDSLGMACR